MQTPTTTWALHFKEQNKLEEAIEAYNKALAIKPDYANAYYNMGIALQEQNKLEEAIEAYNKALAIKPDYAAPTTTWAMHSKSKASWKRR
jgi:tetratricopeptide (TPR) repeat protein